MAVLPPWQIFINESQASEQNLLIGSLTEALSTHIHISLADLVSALLWENQMLFIITFNFCLIFQATSKFYSLRFMRLCFFMNHTVVSTMDLG